VSYPELSGRAALVTGATKGIGREVALRLAAEGCGIGATGRDEAELSSLVQEIETLGVVCESVRAELADAEETVSMARRLDEALGGVDILVNNAGTTFPESIFDVTSEHWDTTMAVNLRAPALITREIARGMASRGWGAIVNVTSTAGLVAHTDHASYCASKYGFNGLTKVLALELGPLGIRVNAVAPTVTLTPMGQKVWGKPEKSEPMLAKIPLGKFACPNNVADAVLFLLSDSASMIHGEILVLDGGYTAQ
jgi:NAD(P)-dependent dehydrogenase (short-subunit alcohol dehydrogenase family)